MEICQKLEPSLDISIECVEYSVETSRDILGNNSIEFVESSVETSRGFLGNSSIKSTEYSLETSRDILGNSSIESTEYSLETSRDTLENSSSESVESSHEASRDNLGNSSMESMESSVETSRDNLGNNSIEFVESSVETSRDFLGNSSIEFMESSLETSRDVLGNSSIESTEYSLETSRDILENSSSESVESSLEASRDNLGNSSIESMESSVETSRDILGKRKRYNLRSNSKKNDKKKTSSETLQEASTNLEIPSLKVDDTDGFKCSICLDTTRRKVMKQLRCSHAFHQLCINDWFKCNRNCPLCREPSMSPHPSINQPPTHEQWLAVRRQLRVRFFERARTYLQQHQELNGIVQQFRRVALSLLRIQSEMQDVDPSIDEMFHEVKEKYLQLLFGPRGPLHIPYRELYEQVLEQRQRLYGSTF